MTGWPDETPTPAPSTPGCASSSGSCRCFTPVAKFKASALVPMELDGETPARRPPVGGPPPPGPPPLEPPPPEPPPHVLPTILAPKLFKTVVIGLAKVVEPSMLPAKSSPTAAGQLPVVIISDPESPAPLKPAGPI